MATQPDIPQNDDPAARVKIEKPGVRAKVPDRIQDEATRALSGPGARQGEPHNRYGQGHERKLYGYDGGADPKHRKGDKLKVKGQGDETEHPDLYTHDGSGIRRARAKATPEPVDTKVADKYKHERADKTADRLAGLLKSDDPKAALGEISRMQHLNPAAWQKVQPLLTARMQGDQALPRDTTVVGSDGNNLVTVQKTDNGDMLQRRSAADISQVLSQEPNLPHVELIDGRSFNVSPDGHVSVVATTDGDSTWGLAQRLIGRDHQSEVARAVKTAGPHPELVHKGQTVNFQVPLKETTAAEAAPEVAPPQALPRLEPVPQGPPRESEVHPVIEPKPAPVTDQGLVKQEDGTFKRMTDKALEGDVTEYTTETFDAQKAPQSKLVEKIGKNNEFLGSTLTFEKPQSPKLPNAGGEPVEVKGVTQIVRDANNQLTVSTKQGDQYTYKVNPDGGDRKYVLQKFEGAVRTDDTTGISTKTIQTVDDNGDVKTTVHAFKQEADKKTDLGSLDLPTVTGAPAAATGFNIGDDGKVTVTTEGGDKYSFDKVAGTDGAEDSYQYTGFEGQLRAEEGNKFSRTSQTQDNGVVTTTTKEYTASDKEPEPGKDPELVLQGSISRSVQPNGDTTLVTSNGDGAMIKSETTTLRKDETGVETRLRTFEGALPPAKFLGLDGKEMTLPKITSVEMVKADDIKITLTAEDGTKYIGHPVEGGGPPQIDKIVSTHTDFGITSTATQSMIKGVDGAADVRSTVTERRDASNNLLGFTIEKIDTKTGEINAEDHGPGGERKSSSQTSTSPIEGGTQKTVQERNEKNNITKTTFTYDGQLPSSGAIGVEGGTITGIREEIRTPNDKGGEDVTLTTDDGTVYKGSQDGVAPLSGALVITQQEKNTAIDGGTEQTVVSRSHGDVLTARTQTYNEPDKHTESVVGFDGEKIPIEKIRQHQFISSPRGDSEILTTDSGVKYTAKRTDDGLVLVQEDSQTVVGGLIHKISQTEVADRAGSLRVETVFDKDQLLSTATTALDDKGKFKSYSRDWTDGHPGTDTVLTGPDARLDITGIKSQTVTTDGDKTEMKYVTDTGTYTFSVASGVATLKDVKAAFSSEPDTEIRRDVRTMTPHAELQALPNNPQNWDGTGVPPVSEIIANEHPELLPYVTQALSQYATELSADKDTAGSFEQHFIDSVAHATTTGDLANSVRQAVGAVESARDAQRGMKFSTAEHALGDLFNVKSGTGSDLPEGVIDPVTAQARALSALSPADLSQRLQVIRTSYDQVREELAREMTLAPLVYTQGDIDKPGAFSDQARKFVAETAAKLTIEHATDPAALVGNVMVAELRAKDAVRRAQSEPAERAQAEPLTQEQRDALAGPDVSELKGRDMPVPADGRVTVKKTDGSPLELKDVVGARKLEGIAGGGTAYTLKSGELWIVDNDSKLVWPPADYGQPWSKISVVPKR